MSRFEQNTPCHRASSSQRPKNSPAFLGRQISAGAFRLHVWQSFDDFSVQSQPLLVSSAVQYDDGGKYSFWAASERGQHAAGQFARGSYAMVERKTMYVYIYIYTKLLLEMYQVNPKIDRNHFQYSFSGHLLFYLFGA